MINIQHLPLLILLEKHPRTRHLPERHHIVRRPAQNKSKNEDPGNLDCLNLSSSYHSLTTGSYKCCLVIIPHIFLVLMGPPVDQEDDAQVAPNHHQQGQQPCHGEQKDKVKKLLGKYIDSYLSLK